MRWFKKPSRGEDALSGTFEAEQRISDILKPAHIKLNAEGIDRDEVIEELVDLLVQTGDIKERKTAVRALLAREEMGSTGIGKGVAVPHAKQESIEKICAALAISQSGLEFDSADGKPVHIVFLLLSQADNPGPSLRALVEIAQLIHNPHVIARLLAAKSPAEVLDTIRSEE